MNVRHLLDCNVTIKGFPILLNKARYRGQTIVNYEMSGIEIISEESLESLALKTLKDVYRHAVSIYDPDFVLG